jgi:hypothetical protein
MDSSEGKRHLVYRQKVLGVARPRTRPRDVHRVPEPRADARGLWSGVGSAGVERALVVSVHGDEQDLRERYI